MKHYMIVDIGTGNSRVALVREDGALICVKTFENIYYIDEAYEDAQYFDPSFWKRNILGLCREIIHMYPNITIDAISSSGARESIVLINRKQEDFYGLPNIDNRGRAWMAEIQKDGIYEKTGRWVTEDFPAAKLMGLSKRRKEIFDQVQTFTSLSEWIGYVLCGKLAIEPSQACETQLYDIGAQQWSEELIKRFKLEQLTMPPLLNAGSLLGFMREDIKEQLGIAYDIPFLIGGADTQVAVLGAGMQEGDIAVVSGTTSPVVTLRTERYCDPQERCWTDSWLKGSMYQMETNPGVTGLNYQRIRNLLFDGVSYEDLEAALKEVNNIKCTASFSSLDFEHACGYKNGGFFMRPPFRADLHRIDLAWALVGDIACSIFYQYRQLLQMLPIQHDKILGCGGGFQSEMLCQHLSDLTQKALVLPDHFHQASIMGCVAVCNSYWNIHTDTNERAYKIYKPQKGSLIQEYYEIWKTNRDRVNTTV